MGRAAFVAILLARGWITVLLPIADRPNTSASSAFGGPCATPTAEALAGAGIKYNRFHTTALCATEDLDHLISPEERLRIAMARQ